MADDADRRVLPFPVDQVRAVNERMAKDPQFRELVDVYSKLPADLREGLWILIQMLLALDRIPRKHHLVIHEALALFSQLTDEERATYLASLKREKPSDPA